MSTAALTLRPGSATTDDYVQVEISPGAGQTFANGVMGVYLAPWTQYFSSGAGGAVSYGVPFQVKSPLLLRFRMPRVHTTTSPSVLFPGAYAVVVLVNVHRYHSFSPLTVTAPPGTSSVTPGTTGLGPLSFPGAAGSPAVPRIPMPSALLKPLSALLPLRGAGHLYAAGHSLPPAAVAPGIPGPHPPSSTNRVAFVTGSLLNGHDVARTFPSLVQAYQAHKFFVYQSPVPAPVPSQWQGPLHSWAENFCNCGQPCLALEKELADLAASVNTDHVEYFAFNFVGHCYHPRKQGGIDLDDKVSYYIPAGSGAAKPRPAVDHFGWYLICKEIRKYFKEAKLIVMIDACVQGKAHSAIPREAGGQGVILTSTTKETSATTAYARAFADALSAEASSGTKLEWDAFLNAHSQARQNTPPKQKPMASTF